MDKTVIHTEGGSAVTGVVQAGTYIGRDVIIVISGYNAAQLEEILPRLQEVLQGGRAHLSADLRTGRLTVTAPGELRRVVLSEAAAADLLPAAGRLRDLSAYLTAVVLHPRYGRWAQQFVPLAGMLTSFERPPGWLDIPPEFVLAEMQGEGTGRQVIRRRIADVTMALAEHPALVLLGEPGAGKTTVLYRLALDAARRRLEERRGPIPLFVPLADYRGYADPFSFLRALWERHIGGEGFGRALRDGELLLLCDALNEMPRASPDDFRARNLSWRRFVEDWPGNRFVFSCRRRDYSEPLGLPQVEIERLDDTRVQEFLGKYLPPEQAEDCWRHLQRSDLLEMVRNPYHLSLLAFVVAERGGWPTGRADLLNRFDGALLRRESTRGHPDWPGEEALRRPWSGWPMPCRSAARARAYRGPRRWSSFPQPCPRRRGRFCSPLRLSCGSVRRRRSWTLPVPPAGRRWTTSTTSSYRSILPPARWSSASAPGRTSPPAGAWRA